MKKQIINGILIILISILIITLLTGIIGHGVHNFEYNAQTKMLFNKGIFEHKEEWSHMIVINPNGKPAFIVARDIQQDRITIGSALNVFILLGGGTLLVMCGCAIYNNITFGDKKY